MAEHTIDTTERECLTRSSERNTKPETQTGVVASRSASSTQYQERSSSNQGRRLGNAARLSSFVHSVHVKREYDKHA